MVGSFYYFAIEDVKAKFVGLCLFVCVCACVCMHACAYVFGMHANTCVREKECECICLEWDFKTWASFCFQKYFQNLQDLFRSWRFTVVDRNVKMQKKEWTVIYSWCNFRMVYFCCDSCCAAGCDEITPCVMCDTWLITVNNR